MKKLFVFDLDGTLLNCDSLILPETIQAIKDLKKMGHYFSIATGRGIASSKDILNQSPDFDFAICNNGVVVKNLKNGEIITNGTLPPELFEYFLEVATQTNSQYTISTIENVFPISLNDFNYPWMSQQDKMDYDIMTWSNPDEVRLAFKNGDQLTQLALRNSEKIAQEMYQKYLKIIGKKYATFLTNKVYYDINPLGSDKKNGVQTLLKKLNLTTDQLVVFGDSGNDIEMIKMAKYGYAMSNATPLAQAAAKEVIGDHNEPTIAKKLYELK